MTKYDWLQSASWCPGGLKIVFRHLCLKSDIRRYRSLNQGMLSIVLLLATIWISIWSKFCQLLVWWTVSNSGLDASYSRSFLIDIWVNSHSGQDELSSGNLMNMFVVWYHVTSSGWLVVEWAMNFCVIRMSVGVVRDPVYCITCLQGSSLQVQCVRACVCLCVRACMHVWMCCSFLIYQIVWNSTPNITLFMPWCKFQGLELCVNPIIDWLEVLCPVMWDIGYMRRPCKGCGIGYFWLRLL